MTPAILTVCVPNALATVKALLLSLVRVPIVVVLRMACWRWIARARGDKCFTCTAKTVWVTGDNRIFTGRCDLAAAVNCLAIGGETVPVGTVMVPWWDVVTIHPPVGFAVTMPVHMTGLAATATSFSDPALEDLVPKTSTTVPAARLDKPSRDGEEFVSIQL